MDLRSLSQQQESFVEIVYFLTVQVLRAIIPSQDPFILPLVPLLPRAEKVRDSLGIVIELPFTA